MIRLGLSPQDRPVSIRTLAEVEELSPEFLEQIFFNLRKGGLIRSTRGPGGGFSLDRDISEISILDIFDAVGESVNLTPCTDDDPENEACGRMGYCIAHDTWKHVNDTFRTHLSGISLKEIIADIDTSS